jgi:methylase of polypeptide subunit release factors
MLTQSATPAEKAYRRAVEALRAAGVADAGTEAVCAGGDVSVPERLPAERQAALDAAVARRCRGEPLPYITGRTTFCGLLSTSIRGR